MNCKTKEVNSLLSRIKTHSKFTTLYTFRRLHLSETVYKGLTLY